MRTSRAAFKINLTKDNGMLTDLSRVGEASQREGEGLENIYQLFKRCSGLTVEYLGWRRRGCVAFA